MPENEVSLIGIAPSDINIGDEIFIDLVTKKACTRHKCNVVQCLRTEEHTYITVVLLDPSEAKLRIRFPESEVGTKGGDFGLREAIRKVTAAHSVTDSPAEAAMASLLDAYADEVCMM